MSKKVVLQKRFAPKFHVKKGDTVIVNAGSSKGKKGIILHIFTDKNKAIVEGINVVKKHVKATQNEAGSIIDMEAPIHISNLSLLDPKSGEPTRIGRREEGGHIVRYSKKSGEIIK